MDDPNDVQSQNVQVPSIDQAHPSDCFYSDYVTELVTKVFTIPPYDCLQYKNIINSDLTFNLEELDLALDQLLSRNDISYDVQLTEEMNQYLERIVPVIDCVHRQFNEIVQLDTTGRKLISIVEGNLFWTGNWKRYFIDSIKIALNWNENLFGNAKLSVEDEKTIRTVLSLYIFTSGLEQSLGNLVLTQSHFVPPLLKTLLTMPELESLIGVCLARLLKIIVGPPITINLRNILWHGFVSCSSHITCSSTNASIEVDYLRFFYFLIAISTTVGVQLQKTDILQKLKIDSTLAEQADIKSLIIDEIPQRKLFNFDEFAFKLENIFPFINSKVVSFHYFRNLITDSPLIHKTFKSLWLAAFSLYLDESNHYRGYCFCLLMPLLESSLRYLYCSINHLSNRLLTAICREYYVTFTEILAFEAMDDEQSTEGCSQSNHLYNLLPESIMILLLDIILLPEGLRFRDRLSHGQIELHNINWNVSNYVFSSIVAVLEWTKLRTNSICSSSTHTNACQPQIIEQLLAKSAHYECLFHPVYQLKFQLNSFAASLLRLIEQAKPHADQVAHCHWKTTLECNLNKNQIVSFNLSDGYISNCDALVLILRNCLINYVHFVENLCSFLSIRSQELSQSKLRSRQRANYQTMLQSMTFFLQAFCAEGNLFCFHSTMLLSLNHITNVWCTTLNQKASLDKLLKRLLKIAENLAQKSSIKENRWDSVMELCTEQSDLLSLICQTIKLP